MTRAGERFMSIAPIFSKNHELSARNAVFFLIAAMLFLTACSKTTILIPPPSTTKTSGQASVPPPSPEKPQDSASNYLEQMRNSFNSGDYDLAAQLAENALQTPGIAQEQAREAWRCLALSEARLERWTNALAALDKWRQTDPKAEATWEWLNIWGAGISRLPSHEAQAQASPILYDDKREALARSRAAMVMASRSLPGADISPLLGFMTAIYGAMPSTTDRSEMEKAFAFDLRKMDNTALQSLDASLKMALAENNISANQLRSYPYVLIQIENARRLAASDDPQIRANGTAELARLCASASLVTDKRLLPALGDAADETDVSSGRLLPGTATAPAESLPFEGPANRSVALLLPMSGHYRTIANRIVKGANIAKNDFAAYGLTLNIIAIDTNQAGWQAKVAALPKELIIGGPLHPSHVGQLKTAGLANGRAVFAFTTKLDPQDEGATLWRFFPSLEDQTRALLNFVSNDMGVSSVASLYPGDAYGRRMTELFTGMARNEFHFETSATEYPPKQHEQWNAIAARILGVKKSTPPMRPRPSFQALFMPDSWLGAQTMVPHILFHQETRLILMGTTLWEQALWEMALQKKNVVDAKAFTLAIFPGAWNPETTVPAGRYLQETALKQTGQPADFWTALGYDFIRFAARMGAPANGPLETLAGAEWHSGEVNSRLQQAADMQWAMAPIQWTIQGKASQELYLFTPVSDGYQLTDPNEFRALLEKTRQQFKSRWGRS